ncbi:hypothetical protein [Photobacterium kishitanii]|uniref:Uncharacterized protein n=1 Tax=Photobacterium kishitanii TaxID=318456 RepID=A0A2T3KKR1_9GAMM|nr:hypothetical protein [Photobacterium kishitanii]PSV00308.1 hypothetical protein C9J27_04070 [Photobacterium kishitanii]
MSKQVIGTTLEEATAIESDLIANGNLTTWEVNGELVNAGEYQIFNGCIYRYLGGLEDKAKNIHFPPNSRNYALHPSSAVKMIRLSCFIPNIVIAIESNQCWLYMPERPSMTYNDSLAYGERGYARAHYDGLSEKVLQVAFMGLLAHAELNISVKDPL